MQMSRHIEDEGTIQVSLSGSLTYLTQVRLRPLLQEIDARHVNKAIIDLSQLSFIDSAGVGCLLALSEKLRNVSGSMSIKNARFQVERVLTMAQTIDPFLKPHNPETRQIAPPTVPRCSEPPMTPYCLEAKSGRPPYRGVKQLLKMLTSAATDAMLANRSFRGGRPADGASGLARCA